MIDFNNLEKVSSVICIPTPNLIVKHSVVLKRKPPYNKEMNNVTNKSLGYAFNYMWSNKEGLYFQNSTVILEFESKKQITQDSKANGNISVCACVRDIPILIHTINKAYSWLTSNANNVFVRDVDDRPIKITNPLLQVGCPVISGNVAFKPCIIRDTQDVRYEGISMGTHKDGEIANFTGLEFSVFKMIVTSFGNNYYIANQLLINQALSYCTNYNLTEVLTRNAKSKR